MKLDNFIINITLAVKGDEIHRKAMTREDESSKENKKIGEGVMGVIM